MGELGHNQETRDNRAARAGAGRRPSGLAGQRIGPYDILEEVGRGGMGVVYKARDRSLDRTVALKVLPPHLATDPDFSKRFIREARAAARLDHTGIVQVYQAGASDDVLFIAMQFVDATPLSKIIDQKGPQGAAFALSMAKQVAEALGVAHAQGIVHRDIKPSNIMVDDRLRVKVMDFGLAKEIDAHGKITRTGSYIGTPEYSSPEQCETLELDGRTDIYSLGVVLYETLTGRVPFSADTPLKLFEKIRYEEPPPIAQVAPGVGKDVAQIVDRMLAKERDDRYPDCAALIADIERVERGEAPKIRTHRRLRAVRRRARASGLAWGVAAFLVAFAAVLYWVGVRGEVTPPVPGPAVAAAGAPAPVPPPAAARRSVVVRDFANSTGRAELEWLRVGIADMLITDLAGCDFLDVYSREKVRALPAAGDGRVADIELKGSFAEAAGRIMVVAQLVDLEAGTVMRAVRAQGTEADIFSVIDDISTQVRGGLEDLLVARLGRAVKLSAAPGGVSGRLFAAAKLDKAEGMFAAPAAERAAYGRAPAGRPIAAGRSDRKSEERERDGDDGGAADGAAAPLRMRGGQGGGGAAARESGRDAGLPLGDEDRAVHRELKGRNGLIEKEAKEQTRAGAQDAPAMRPGAREEAPPPEAPPAQAQQAPAKKAAGAGAPPAAPGAPPARRSPPPPAATAAAPEASEGAPARALAADRLEVAAEALAAPEPLTAQVFGGETADAGVRGPAEEAAKPAGALALVAAGAKAESVSSGPGGAPPDERKAGTLAPRIAAVRALYRARMIVETDDSPEALGRALVLLEEARRLAPMLRSIDDEIEALRARLAPQD